MPSMTKTSSVRRMRRRRRIRGRIEGTAQRPRLSVFRSSVHVYAQLIDDAEGKTLAAASTLDKAIKDAEAAPKTARAEALGRLIAERTKSIGIERVVFDRGGYLYHGRVKAVADGARAAGLEF